MQGSSEPSARLFSICNDIAIYISELVIAQSRSVHWHFCIEGKRNVYYHRPVLIGFNVANPRYVVDIDYALCTYTYRVLKTGECASEHLPAIYESIMEDVGKE